MLVFVYLSHKIVTPALLHGECFELGYERTAFLSILPPISLILLAAGGILYWVLEVAQLCH
jgi:hypothetical protein